MPWGYFSKERILGSEHEAIFKSISKAKGYLFLVTVMYQLIKMRLRNTQIRCQSFNKCLLILGTLKMLKAFVLARKQEFYSTQCDLELYFTSLSRKTIVYKGWLRSDQIKNSIQIYRMIYINQS